MKKLKIACAVSGGVDSLATTMLLKNRGFEVFGISMRVHDSWNEEEVKKIISQLNIPHYIIDLRQPFEKEVINYFISEYLNGRTPNPCAVCNKKIKFGYLLEKAFEFGADFFATGHYARIERIRNPVSRIQNYILKQGKDKQKDQSYFLATLPREVLSKIMFPLGDYTKNEVREITKGLKTLPESNEICFIPDNNYVNFIRTRQGAGSPDSSTSSTRLMAPLKECDLFDKKGTFLGKQGSIIELTIGQRKGIKKPRDKPYYVISINSKENKVIIGDKEDLYADSLIAEKLNWLGAKKLIDNMSVDVKVRYRKTCSKAIIFPYNKGRSGPLTRHAVLVKFAKPEKAITSGQLVVFYENESVLGSGWIQ